MKKINIEGSEYVMVNERLKHFRENYENWSLISEIIRIDDDEVIIKASIIDPDNKVVATGHAMEKQGSSFVNKTSHIENAETSAWGRALANFGIGIDTSVASYEEVANAKKQQEDIEVEDVELDREYEMTFGKHKGKKIKDIGIGYLNWLADNARNPEMKIIAGKERRFRSLKEIWDQYNPEKRKEITEEEPKNLTELEEYIELAKEKDKS